MPWYTVNTKSQHERVAELSLQQLGVETFYPQLKQRKVIRRRAETRIGPLFPSYLFARFQLDTHYRAVTYARRSEEHTSELQSQSNLVCRLLLEKKKNKKKSDTLNTHITQ